MIDKQLTTMLVSPQLYTSALFNQINAIIYTFRPYNIYKIMSCKTKINFQLYYCIVILTHNAINVLCLSSDVSEH